MICLFKKDEASFTNNGLCVLSPTVCTVFEEAGGSYVLHMEHPMDEDGKFLLLQEEMIIRAPVPKRVIPQITLPQVKVWKTTEQADLYSSLPYYKANEVSDVVKNVRARPGDYAWNVSQAYNKGAVVTYSGDIYTALQYNFAVIPTSTSAVWSYMTTVSGGSGSTYIPGTVIETLAANTQIAKVADYNAQFMQVRTMLGVTGYIERSKCEETESETSGQVIDGRTITEQLFRIFRVESEEDTHSITVEAKHISYDFRGNTLRDCTVTEADPMTAVSMLHGSLALPDDRLIVTNVTGKKITEDWSFLNPVNVMLDPESGLLHRLGAALIRDNADFFMLDNSTPRKGITIRYGVNMTGVRWSRDSENVVTRIMPRCNNGAEGYLYLENMYVDSSIIGEYAFPRIEVLDCDCTVGEEYEKQDGTKEKWTEQTARAKMLEEAQARFSKDHADGVEVSLEVNFLLLGDTEEFKQYKGLQDVCLYDEIQVITGKTGIKATAQVSEYEFDSILERYNYIKIGEVSSFSRRIPGYRVVRNSITYDKLSADLISRIRSANASGSTDSGSQGATPSGGAVAGVAANSKDNDGIVLKGSGNGNKVWKTDSQGNPGWGILLNTSSEDGMVAKGQGNANKVWATDASGNPAWRSLSDLT